MNKMNPLKSKNEQLLAENRTLNEDIVKLSDRIQQLEIDKSELGEDFKGIGKELQDKLDNVSGELRKIQPDNLGEASKKIKTIEEDLKANCIEGNEKLEKKLDDYKSNTDSSLEKEKQRCVQPRKTARKRTDSSKVFTPIYCENAVEKFYIKVQRSCYHYGLDISKSDVLAVACKWKTVYLYSETTGITQKLRTFPSKIWCLAWDQKGESLAIGGACQKNGLNTIQIWKFPEAIEKTGISKMKLFIILRVDDMNQSCMCLDWNEGSIVAGTTNYVYKWDINDEYKEGGGGLKPVNDQLYKSPRPIKAVQWSNCKSRLATITSNGDVRFYNKNLDFLQEIKSFHTRTDERPSFLQWCSQDNQVIAICILMCLEIFRVEPYRIGCTEKSKGISSRIKPNEKMAHDIITRIQRQKFDSIILVFKWIPGTKTIMVAFENGKLILWNYENPEVIQTIGENQLGLDNLAINGDSSVIVSRSATKVTLWESFNELKVKAKEEKAPKEKETSEEEEAAEEEEATEEEEVADEEEATK
eukprot:CAMPEP_0175055138 /NCGR_PEP_ID=MMETSP0052_2-20121109/9906_1 /TAXON_ID=51329 ORGANISM="Polytomella parva, Strain SAG 63-3" /NCGR_SAMPLE_ID=MMETSP0052_2 /ASSEMBLY_ACC=CAM_ASM_000194 /LENGTH=528 /DNA_ID=CAMNT_0016319935 /DNA_START=220 /DNA_END=1807 /DNA_ORIENTATION=-